MSEETFNADDPEQVNQVRVKAGRKKIEIREFISKIMDTETGRAWMNDVLINCHIWSPSYTEGDTHATAFREGERNVGLRLMADIQEWVPELYIKMVREAKLPK